jgi:hypothetical protein
VADVLQSPDDVQSSQNRRPGKRAATREAIDFDTLQVPFKVGQGQFTLDGAQLRGPLLGASIAGKADLRAQRLDLGGSYIPLQGLNAALSGVPLLGQLLTGPKGEGMMGITFAVQGPMSAPQVIVNPLSLIGIGPFRDLFQMSSQNTTITPRDDKPAAVPIPRKSVGPTANEPVRAPSAAAPKKPVVQPEVGGSWSTEQSKPAAKSAPRAAAPPVPVQ